MEEYLNKYTEIVQYINSLLSYSQYRDAYNSLVILINTTSSELSTADVNLLIQFAQFIKLKLYKATHDKYLNTSLFEQMSHLYAFPNIIKNKFVLLC